MFFEIKNNDFKIIGDIFLAVSESYKSEKPPLITAADSLIKTPLTEESVLDMINQWLVAWSGKNMEKYATKLASD